MPLRVSVDDKNLSDAMETALVEGLQQKYIVFSGEQVSQKAHEIFMRESRNLAHKECDETRCMQNIAEAFQAELIATSNVTKQDGGYFLALSIQNIFDNQVEYSRSIACAKCTSFQLVDKLKELSGSIINGASDAESDELQKEADRKAIADQLKKEQLAFEEKLRNSDAAERKQLLEAKAAEDKRLSELKAAADVRRKDSEAQPTSFPSLVQAHAELAMLDEKIAVIETGYAKELASTIKQVKELYSGKLDALDKERRDEFESNDEFKAKQEKKRNDLISQRDAELSRMNASTVAEIETAPLKARIKALTEHGYLIGSDGIQAELGLYDADDHQFPVKLRSKNSPLQLKINGSIPLLGEEAITFKQQWQAGLVRPQAIAKFNGELVDVSLINDADNSVLNSYSGRFMTEIIAKAGVMIPIPGKNYELGKYDVTQAQWKLVMDSNPSYFENCGGSCPVESISWNDVQQFLQKLNAMTGRQYRLPNEEEWEYACYGGSITDYCGGNDIDGVAWYKNNSKSWAWSFMRSIATTHPVGKKQANGYGLYDMSGNVWQWMENKLDSKHNSRMLRGGSWVDDADNMRAALREYGSPNYRGRGSGFRLARTLP